MKKKKAKIETTKKLLIFTDGLLSLSVITTFIGWFINKEPSSIVQLDVALIGLSATLHSFYIWKSKVENCNKYPNITKLIEMGAIKLNDIEGGIE